MRTAALLMFSRRQSHGFHDLGCDAIKIVAEPLGPQSSKTPFWPPSFTTSGGVLAGDLFVVADVVLERIDGAWFQQTLLDHVRDEHPGVKWRVFSDVPGLPSGWPGIAFGVVERLYAVASVCPFKPDVEPVPFAAERRA